MIKVIYFDFFNVLCNPPLTQIIQRIIPASEQHKYTDRLNELDLGNISLKEYVKELSDGSGLTEDQINEEIDSAPKLDLNLIEFIKNKLKDNYRIGLFTNALNTTIYKILDRNIDIFDIKLISSEVKLIKPNKRIFELAIDMSKVRSNEILFIDDNEKNIDAARELGINTIHYAGFEAFVAEINSINF